MFIDIVFPDKNENSFIKMADKLNIDALCFVYGYKDLQKSKIRLYRASMKNKADLTLVRTTDPRLAIEKIRPDIVFGLEKGRRSDPLHQRSSGLNHVLCRLAREKDVSIGLTPDSDARILGRIKQNIKLCRKFKNRTIIATFAKSPYELRAPADLASLFISLGMHPKEAADSLSAAEWMIERNTKRKSPKYIKEGVELV